MEAVEALKKIQADAEKHTADPRVAEVEMGTGPRQGDIYLIRIPPEAIKETRPWEGNQLAMGASRGASHRIEGDATIWAPNADRGTLLHAKHQPESDDEDMEVLFGPQIVVGDKGATLTHETHGHYQLPAGTCWQSFHQMDARTRKRVLD